MQVNRYLKNEAMDRMDHALGRPLDPARETYRNFYATGGALADEMAGSPFWIEGKPQKYMRFFAVSGQGRRALAEHLREIGDPHRAYSVTFDGHTRSIVATSRDNAKYIHYLDISEVMPDLSFMDYCRRTRVTAQRAA